METQAFIPGTTVFDLAPTGGGPAWRIFLAVPQAPAPLGGFPLVLMLDANAGFATFVETLRRGAMRPRATGIVPAVVVGVGYPTDDTYDRERRTFDYTAGPSTEAADGRATGGRDAFLAFLTDRLLPEIAARCALDPSRRTLFGHSLAGAFVLDVMGRNGSTFANYVAVSPSIWWDEPRVTSGLATAATGEAKRLAIYVGEWEQALAPWQLGQPDIAELQARRSRRAMVDRAEAFAAKAKASLPAGSSVDFMVMPEEDHASVFPVAISRALRFVLRS